MNRRETTEQVRSRIIDQINYNVCAKFCDGVWNEAWHQINDNVSHTIYQQLNDQINNPKNDKVFQQIRSNINKL